MNEFEHIESLGFRSPTTDTAQDTVFFWPASGEYVDVPLRRTLKVPGRVCSITIKKTAATGTTVGVGEELGGRGPTMRVWGLTYER